MEEAVRLAHDLRPEVLVMDCTAEGALPAIRSIKAAVPACDVVVLTNRLVQPEAERIFAEGASGYVCRDIPGHVLLTTLRALCTIGESRPIILSSEARTLFHASPRGRSVVQMNRLTTREIAILAELSSGSTDLEIARKFSVHEGTVKTHVRHILRKLGVRNRTAAIAQALRGRLID